MPFGVMPYPDNLFLNDGGFVQLAAFPFEGDSEYIASLRDGLGTIDGFGSVSPIYFPLDDAIDPSTLPESPEASIAEAASAYLLDMETTPFTAVPAHVRWLEDEQMIAVRPVLPLEESHRYAAVLSDRVEDVGGSAVLPAGAFAEMRDTDSAPADPALASAFEHYAPFFAERSAGDVVALTVFRVQSQTGALAQVRDQAQSLSPTIAVSEGLSGAALDARLGTPVMDVPGLLVESGVKHDFIAWMVNGTFPVPNYLDEDPQVHGRFVQRDGNIVEKSIGEAHFTLTLPDAVDNPPIVVFQHGVGNERSEMLGLADTLAAAGYATIAIDAPFHGLRATGAVDATNILTGEETPDGFGDSRNLGVVLGFFGIVEAAGEYPALHPFYFRDTLRQSAADLFVLVRALRAGDWSAAASLDPALTDLSFESSRMNFIGHSVGGIIGTLFCAHETELGQVVIANSGAHFTELVQRSVTFNLNLSLLFSSLNLALEVDYVANPPILYPSMGLWQSLIDAGDAASHARLLPTRDVDILLTMSVDDETVPNSATELLAATAGVPIIGASSRFVQVPRLEFPVVNNAGERTRGLTVFGPATHAAMQRQTGTQTSMAPPEPPFEPLEEPVIIDNPMEAIQAQLLRFLEVGEIIEP